MAWDAGAGRGGEPPVPWGFRFAPHGVYAMAGITLVAAVLTFALGTYLASVWCVCMSAYCLYLPHNARWKHAVAADREAEARSRATPAAEVRHAGIDDLMGGPARES